MLCILHAIGILSWRKQFPQPHLTWCRSMMATLRTGSCWSYLGLTSHIITAFIGESANKVMDPRSSLKTVNSSWQIRWVVLMDEAWKVSRVCLECNFLVQEQGLFGCFVLSAWITRFSLVITSKYLTCSRIRNDIRNLSSVSHVPCQCHWENRNLRDLRPSVDQWPVMSAGGWISRLIPARTFLIPWGGISVIFNEKAWRTSSLGACPASLLWKLMLLLHLDCLGRGWKRLSNKIRIYVKTPKDDQAQPMWDPGFQHKPPKRP